MVPETIKFKYKIEFVGKEKELEYDIHLPFKRNCTDIVYTIINKFDLSSSWYKTIEEALCKFIEEQERERYFQASDKVFSQIAESSFDKSKLINYWKELFTTQCAAFIVNMPKFEVILKFCEEFNELLSVARQPELVRAIIGYRQAIDKLYASCDTDLKEAEKEYRYIKSKSDSNTTDFVQNYKNKLIKIRTNWQNHIIEQERIQKKEFWKWVTESVENQPPIDEKTKTKPVNYSMNEGRCESYSFKFGYQLKCTHNINVCSCSIHSYFKMLPDFNFYYQNVLQNMLSLYTHNLSALVILTDHNLPSKTKIEKSLFNSCYASTEFHFTFLSEQLDAIHEEASKAGHTELNVGDYYVTTHSNLAKVQVVFHLVYDLENIKNVSLNMHNPIIIGLTNIFELCLVNGISGISFPLLLEYEIKDEIMNSRWCLKRAESMLKCLKGIILQTTPFHSSPPPCNINLLLPKEISSEIFQSLCSLIQQTYTSSNALNLTGYM